MSFDTFKESLLRTLNKIEGNKAFASCGTTSFVNPGLEIDNELVSFLLPEAEAKRIISFAHKAPFGKGSETVLDNTVRSAWEIDAKDLKFTNPKWEKSIDSILKKIKVGLALEDKTIEAHLYKLLLYEKGDFFLSHKDSEKEKGMFGTLILGLPSKHEDGVLEIVKGQEILQADFSKNIFDLNYAAFYADISHEVKPLKSGYRLCLVYNLVYTQSPVLSLKKNTEYFDELSSILGKSKLNAPAMVLLEHQYTPENFSDTSLKGNDSNRAHGLILAAEKAGFVAKLCLLTSYLEGEDLSAVYGDWNNNNDSPGEMGEIYTDYKEIKHWAPSNTPDFKNLEIEPELIIADYKLNDGEPIKEEKTGYTGNWGMTIEYWYHYGAVVFWPKNIQFDLVAKESLESKLTWLDYYIKNRKGEFKNEIKKVLISISSNANFNHGYLYNAVPKAFLLLNDAALFKNNDIQNMMQMVFRKCDTEEWLNVVEFYGLEPLMPTLRNCIVSYENFKAVIELIIICIKKGINNDNINELITRIGRSWAGTQVDRESIKDFTKAFEALILLSEVKDIAFLADSAITMHQKRRYVNEAILLNLLKTNIKNDFVEKCIEFSTAELESRTAIEPKPPVDFKREAPSKIAKYDYGSILIDFLENPHLETLEFRKAMTFREEMMRNIDNSGTDLQYTVIKQGSPHLLLISKTNKSYKLKHNKWKEDMDLLKRICEK